jgi:hypothetical protein
VRLGSGGHLLGHPHEGISASHAWGHTLSRRDAVRQTSKVPGHQGEQRRDSGGRTEKSSCGLDLVMCRETTDGSGLQVEDDGRERPAEGRRHVGGGQRGQQSARCRQGGRQWEHLMDSAVQPAPASCDQSARRLCRQHQDPDRSAGNRGHAELAVDADMFDGHDAHQLGGDYNIG